MTDEKNVGDLLKAQGEQIQVLAERVSALESFLASRFGVLSGGAVLLGDGPAAGAPSAESGDRGLVTFFSLAASVAFILAVALALRTLVDTGTIGRPAGAGAGIAYGVGLLVFSYVRYRRARRPIPVYGICGGFLIYSIILETQWRYQVFAIETAYALLALPLVLLSTWGMRHRLPSLAALGVLGSLLSGIALEFPEAHFRYLTSLALLAAGLAYWISAQRRWRWIYACALLLLALIWSWWRLKLTAQLTEGADGARFSAYLPVLCIFGLALFAMPIHAMVSSGRPFGWIDVALLAVTPAAAYLLAHAAISPAALPETGVAGTAAGLALLAAAAFLVRGDTRKRAASRGFVVAATSLFLIALPDAVEHPLAVAAIWSLAAVGLAAAAFKWGEHVPCATACAVQTAAFGQALFRGRLFEPPALPSAEAGFMTALVAATALHYAVARKWPPEPKNVPGPAARFVNGCVVLVLLFCAIYTFALSRGGLAAILTAAGSPSSFSCGQTILINLGAAVLAFLGVKWREDEMAVVAVGVFILGAAKLFLHDLSHCQGLPLVLAMCSFGSAALLGSVLWRMRQQSARPTHPGPL